MNVAIYARVSTKDKGQTNDNQLPDLRRYALAHGWTIYKEYAEHESGGTAERAQFKLLFEDARQRRFDLVLFWSLDRFSREGPLPTLQHLNRLEQFGVGFKSFSEQYLDSTGIFKEAVISILSTIAKQERVRLSERTKAGLVRARANGKVIGRPSADGQREHVLRLKATGISNRAIATALGLSPTTVGKLLLG